MSGLVLDIRKLERRPGAMSAVEREAAAPAGWGVALAKVPQGSPIALSLRLESVLEGVWVSGTAVVQVEAECARCLDPVAFEEVVSVEELFAYPKTDARGRPIEAAEADPEDEPAPEVVDDHIDLEPLIRDQVVLDMPLAPLCRPDCPGLCPVCGTRMAEDPAHAHQQTDPRWASLSALLAEPEG